MIAEKPKNKNFLEFRQHYKKIVSSKQDNYLKSFGAQDLGNRTNSWELQSSTVFTVMSTV